MTVIPYEFDKDAFDAKERSIIEKATQELANQVSVIQFVPRSTSLHHLPYLRFNGDKVVRENPYLAQYPACWTHVGWQGTSHNVINLEGFCISPGFIKHELLHTLGMWHLTSRFDRDDYVTVIPENIVPGFDYCFRKRIQDDTLGFPYYDYDSIMNLANTDFAKYGTKALLSPEPIGQLDHVSDGDILRVRLLYQCRSGPRTYDEYLAQPCTQNCPCWQDQEGDNIAMNCHGNDDACQGSLVCSSQTGRCIQPDGDKANTASQAEMVTMWSAQIALVASHARVTIGAVLLLIMASFGVLLSLSLVRLASGGGWVARRVRREYETIP